MGKKRVWDGSKDGDGVLAGERFVDYTFVLGNFQTCWQFLFCSHSIVVKQKVWMKKIKNLRHFCTFGRPSQVNCSKKAKSESCNLEYPFLDDRRIRRKPSSLP
jgi:hypothetical protein